MAKKSPTPESPVAQFEQSLQELEQLVATLEGGELPLEQSLSAYERGVALYRQCQQALEQAQLRVNLLNDPAQPETAVAFDPPSA
ncbi:MAG: exodeoxyribonuclease VII small subunit [Stenotrophomonas sp.]